MSEFEVHIRRGKVPLLRLPGALPREVEMDSVSVEADGEESALKQTFAAERAEDRSKRLRVYVQIDTPGGYIGYGDFALTRITEREKK